MSSTGPRVPPRVQIRYEITGAQEGAAAVAALTQATVEHARAADGTAASAETYDRAIEGVTAQVTELKAAQDATNTSTRAADQNFDQLAQRGVMLASRFAGVANAAGSLLTRLGDAEGGRTAGLVGSVAANIAQFAALGSMLGPAGALVGGIIGATTAIANLVEAHNDGAEAAAAHETALRGVATAARAAREAVSETRDIEFAAANPELAATVLGGASDQALISRRDVEIARMNEMETGARALSEEEETRLAQLAASGNETARSRVEAERTLDATRSLVGALDAELERRNALAGVPAPAGPASPASPAAARHGGGARRAAAAEEEPVDDGAFAEQMRIEAEAAGIERLAARRAEIRATEAEWAQEDADHAAQIVDELEAIANARHERELERIEIERAARRKTEAAAASAAEDAQAEAEARIQMVVDMGASLAQGLGGAFMSAFEGAIQGQEDFGAAMLKGTKMLLMQFGTQMVAEGIGALFTAVGSIATPPIAAAKAAEGVGKIALGVGLGAAGAAIPTGGGGAPSATAARPRVDSAPSGGGASSAPVVVNLNAPTVMGGTHAEVGRSIGTALQAGMQRYGSGGLRGGLGR